MPSLKKIAVAAAAFSLWAPPAAKALDSSPSAPTAYMESVPLPAGTLPLYVPDPVLPAAAGGATGFGCFKACGPSCDCLGRVDGHVTTRYQGKICEWRTIQCATHPFCEWHDLCYSRCDFQVPGQVGDGSVKRFLCYRACDIACAYANDPVPVGGWEPPSLDPGPPPEKGLGVIECTRRLIFGHLTLTETLTYAELLGCSS